MTRAMLTGLALLAALAAHADDRGVGVRKNPPAPQAPDKWAAEAREQLVNAASRIGLKISTGASKQTFRAGDLVRYKVITDTPGYLYLIVFSEKNVATCIFPNEIDSQNRVAAGTIHLPRNDAYSFPVQEPFGKDLAVAILTTQPLELEAGRVDYTWDEIFTRLRSPALATGVERERTRGVGVAAQKDWQAATVMIETRPR
jgi:hypothetical protein